MLCNYKEALYFMRIVTDYLDHSAAIFPDKAAVVDQHRTVTFKQLREESLHVASYIIRHYKKRHMPVCFYLDKSAYCISSMMGIAYSGNFYTPIDTKMPASRIEKILETLEKPLMITDRKHLEQVQQFAGDSDVFCLEEAMAEDYDEEEIREAANQIIDTDVLYVLFTSGSTGNPKGVIIGHRSVMDYIDWVTDTFHFDETTVLGNQEPFYFDNSILDIYSMLKTGATMYLIPQINFAFPIKLLEYMAVHKINTIFWVPSALCLVANLRALSKRHVDSLKNILFCGEVMPNKQLNQWRREYPDALFGNLYGPTEITDVCAAYIIDRDFRDDEALPMGKACRNTDIFLLDSNDQLITEAEVPGELCVRGTCLAYGYYNNPEKTRSAFVQNPLNKAYPETIYRTGDLVKYNDRGELVYICRKDYQIKHMGHRIELGEIETAASSIPGVNQNCCVYDDVRHKIVMYYTGHIDEKELSKGLKTLLPAYMIPGIFISLRVMPLNLNGKIDRVLLKKELGR